MQLTVVADAAAVGWMAQLLWELANRADAFVSALAHQAAWTAAGLTLLRIIAASVPALRKQAVAEHNNS